MGPFERLGHRAVVILNEGQHFCLQVRHAGERPPPEEFAYQDREPDFHLVHPGRVIRGGVTNDLVGGITQERCPPRHQGQDALFALLAQILLDA